MQDKQRYLNQGDLHLSSGEPEKAIEQYDLALAEDEKSYVAWLGKGSALKLLDRCRDALFCYEQALKLKNDSATAECLADFMREEVSKKEKK